MSRFLFIRNATSIRKKILYSFLVFLGLVWVYSTYAVYEIKSLVKSTDEVVNQKVEIVQLTNDLLNSVEVRALSANTYLLTGNKDYKDSFIGASNQAKEITDKLGKYHEYSEMTKATEIVLCHRHVLL